MKSQLTFDQYATGLNIELSSNQTVARRQTGFCDGILLSKNYVLPGELVAVEVLETEPGWSGTICLGFTLLTNQSLIPLPRMTVPDLTIKGMSWVFPVGIATDILSNQTENLFRPNHPTQYYQRLRSLSTSDVIRDLLPSTSSSMMVHSQPSATQSSVSAVLSTSKTICSSFSCPCCLRTPLGRLSLSSLTSVSETALRSRIVAKGNLLAFYYELEPLRTNGGINLSKVTTDLPESSNAVSQSNFYQFSFHIVFKGVDFVAAIQPLELHPNQLCETSLSSATDDGRHSLDPTSNNSVEVNSNHPTSKCPLPMIRPKIRAVFDVYGGTKSIRLIPVEQTPVPSLRRLCCCLILSRLITAYENQLLRDPDELKRLLCMKTADSESLLDYFSCERDNLQTSLMDIPKYIFLLNALKSLPLPRLAFRPILSDIHAIARRELCFYQVR